MKNGKIILSKYQEDIRDSYRNTKKNILIDAAPGSAKTTTLLMLLDFVPAYKKTAFIAFNRSIVEELETKVPKRDNIKVSTLHSVGCRAIYQHFAGKVSTKEYKTWLIAKEISRSWKIPKSKIDFYIYNISKIVDLYRLSLHNDYKSIQDIINYYDIDVIDKEEEHSKRVLDKLFEYNENWHPKDNKDKFMIDFTDMLYLPVKYNYKLFQYDEVFFDEIQDSNKVQQALFLKIIKPGGRFVGAGDKYQAIYGFMGSDNLAFENLQKIPNTITLPLSFSYRCGKEIVKKVNSIWDRVESPEFQHEGEVIESGSVMDARDGDFVLCRNNKPLVELYFEFLLDEKVCYIRGREVGASIIKLVNRYSDSSKEEALSSLKMDLHRVWDELKNKGIRNPINHPRYVNMKEKIQIIEFISKKHSSMKDAILTIEKMFKDEGEGIVLSTIHKAKGLEANNVFITKQELIPSPWATTVWQQEQEENLLYVAYSRAKNKLTICHD